MQTRFRSTALALTLALGVSGAAHATGPAATESGTSPSQDGPRYYAYCATLGTSGLNVWVSDVFSSRDYHMGTWETLAAQNAFSAYLGANHPQASRGNITCHPAETFREAEQQRNNRIAEWRSDRFTVHMTLWTY